MLLRFHVFHTCWTLFFRLKELNFEVKTYSNLKQMEVLEKISKAKYMLDHLHSNDPEQQDNHVRTNTWHALVRSLLIVQTQI